MKLKLAKLLKKLNTAFYGSYIKPSYKGRLKKKLSKGVLTAASLLLVTGLLKPSDVNAQVTGTLYELKTIADQIESNTGLSEAERDALNEALAVKCSELASKIIGEINTLIEQEKYEDALSDAEIFYNIAQNDKDEDLQRILAQTIQTLKNHMNSENNSLDDESSSSANQNIDKMSFRQLYRLDSFQRVEVAREVADELDVNYSKELFTYLAKIEISSYRPIYNIEDRRSIRLHSNGRNLGTFAKVGNTVQGTFTMGGVTEDFVFNLD
jgi:hypothetical protein